MTNVAGAIDEDELVEETEGNEAGGGWTPIIRISMAVCPTSACTNSCQW